VISVFRVHRLSILMALRLQLQAHNFQLQTLGELQEPWIGYLLTFHVFLLTAAVLKRRSQAVTATIFFLASASPGSFYPCTLLGSCCTKSAT
jgi:hypothetical protein